LADASLPAGGTTGTQSFKHQIQPLTIPAFPGDHAETRLRPIERPGFRPVGLVGGLARRACRRSEAGVEGNPPAERQDYMEQEQEQE
jgi:hypothetical protein